MVVDVLVADQLKLFIVFSRLVGHQKGACVHLLASIWCLDSATNSCRSLVKFLLFRQLMESSQCPMGLYVLGGMCPREYVSYGVLANGYLFI